MGTIVNATLVGLLTDKVGEEVEVAEVVAVRITERSNRKVGG